MNYRLSILLSILSTIAFGQDDKELNKSRSTLKHNKVKTIKIYENKYTNPGDTKKKGFLMREEEYNTEGYIISSVFHYAEGRVKFDTPRTFEYDKKGNIIYNIDSSDLVFNDKKQLIIKKNGPYERREFKYDENGNIMEEKWYYFYPNSYFIDKYEYNNLNQKVKMFRIEPSGKLYFSFDYYYDTMGNEIKSIRFENSDTTDVFTQTFDESGREISTACYDYQQGKKKISWSQTIYLTNGLIDHEIIKLSSAKRIVIRKYDYGFY